MQYSLFSGILATALLLAWRWGILQLVVYLPYEHDEDVSAHATCRAYCLESLAFLLIARFFSCFTTDVRRH